jgi:hypothetical protein
MVCTAVTLIFSPSITVDAFNPVKFLVMCLGVSYLFLRYKSIVLESLDRDKLGNFLAVGVVMAFLALISNHYSFSERFFGIERRNFGFVTVISLFALGFKV